MAIELDGDIIMTGRIMGRAEKGDVIENDVIVPDIKPDIEKVLLADGDVFVRNIGVEKGKAVVSGVIRYKIIYSSEEEENRIVSIATDVPFSRDVEMTGAGEGMLCTGDCRIDHVEYEVSNSRKMNLKAFINLSCKARQDESFRAVDNIRGIEDIQVLRGEYDFKRYTGSGKENFVVNESFELPAGNSPIKEILRTDISVTEIDTKMMENKVVSKGEIRICTLYLSEDPEESIQHMEHDMPFSQTVELPGVTGDAVCDVKCRILDYRCRPEEDIDGEMRLFDMEIEGSLEVTGFTDTKTELITDAYSPSRGLSLERENVRIEGFGGRASEKVPLKEIVGTGEENPVLSKVHNVVTRPVVSGFEVSENRVNVEGLVECSLLYISDEEESPICSFAHEIPFKQKLDIEGVRPGDDCDVSLRVEGCNYSILSSEEIEIRITLDVSAVTSRISEIPVITAVAEEEEEEEEKRTERQPSVLLYFARSGDSLWNIAKKYRTTIPEIVEANEMDEEMEPAAGQQILIP